MDINSIDTLRMDGIDYAVSIIEPNELGAAIDGKIVIDCGNGSGFRIDCGEHSAAEFDTEAEMLQYIENNHLEIVEVEDEID